LQGGRGRTAFQKGSPIERVEKTSDGHGTHNATFAWRHQFEEQTGKVNAQDDKRQGGASMETLRR
jgi:hypothetical protein